MSDGAVLDLQQIGANDGLPFDQPAPPVVDKALLVARTGGVVEWICPSCTRMHRTRPTVNGRLQCEHMSCQRKFLVGFALVPTLGAALPPWNGRYFDQPVPRTSHNVPEPELASLQQALPVLARLAGPLEWRCQVCAGWNYAYPEWTTGSVQCACGVLRYVVAVLRAPAPVRVQAPKDWVSYVAMAFPRRQRLGALGSRGRRLRVALLRGSGTAAPASGAGPDRPAAESGAQHPGPGDQQR